MFPMLNHLPSDEIHTEDKQALRWWVLLESAFRFPSLENLLLALAPAVRLSVPLILTRPFRVRSHTSPAFLPLSRGSGAFL